MTDKQEELKKAYSDIFRLGDKPEWAKKKSNNKNEIVHPSIPFVGENYDKRRLLLYASAENLTKHKETLDDNEEAINRHRRCFDESKNRDKKKNFFSKIHIAPVECGALIIVTAYVLGKLDKNIKYKNPDELIEEIAVGNFGKFSIDSIKNKDYAKDINKLGASLDYVKKDLEILQPNILILPVTIYRHKVIREMIDKTLDKPLVIPIYQINPGVVNRHISPNHNRKTPEEIGYLSEWQSSLTGGFNGKSNDNFYSVYTYLDKQGL